MTLPGNAILPTGGGIMPLQIGIDAQTEEAVVLDSNLERHDSASGGQDRVTRERHIPLSGVPTGCLRWRRWWQRRFGWRWRRELDLPTSPPNGQRERDQGSNDHHRRHPVG